MLIRTLILGTALAVSGVACAADVDTTPADKSASKESAFTAAQLEQRGDLFRSQKDYGEARHYYERALKMNPKNAKIWNKLGVMALSNREYDNALTDFLQSVKYDKKYAEAVNNLGVAYYLKKDYQRAEQQYRRAIELTDTASFHSNLGALYFERDEPKQALEQYKIALQMDPQVLERSSTSGISARTNSPQEKGRYAFLMARLYAKLGDVDHSLDHLKRAMQNGYKPPDDFMTDSDFAGVRLDPRFPAVMSTLPDATE